MKDEIDRNPNNPALLSDKEKHELLKMSEISLWLDGYDDIFSDFDPRPYSQRGLSVDFLDEAKRAAVRMATSGSFQLKFLVPISQRNIAHENTIKKRLREYFKRHHDILEKEIVGIIHKGVIFAIIGLVLMFLGSLILFKYPQKTLFIDFLIILLQPAGWFFFWEGLGLIIFESKERKPEMEFYDKMNKAEIKFMSY
jgi:hypothetical protein